MSIGVPTYTVQCDESGCRNIATFIMAQPHPGIYEFPVVDAVYALFGGETLPDGKHRCATCRAKTNPESPSVEEFQKNVDRIVNTPGVFASIELHGREPDDSPEHDQQSGDRGPDAGDQAARRETPVTEAIGTTA